MGKKVWITVVTENTAQGPGVLAEHGLAYWIDLGSQYVLFDTGQGAVLAHNTFKLAVERLGPAHCTGPVAVAELWTAFPDQCFACHTGSRLEFEVP